MVTTLKWLLVLTHCFLGPLGTLEVNHDSHGGTALDALIWDNCGILKPRSSSIRVIVDNASLPGRTQTLRQHRHSCWWWDWLKAISCSKSLLWSDAG